MGVGNPSPGELDPCELCNAQLCSHTLWQPFAPPPPVLGNLQGHCPVPPPFVAQKKGLQTKTAMWEQLDLWDVEEIEVKGSKVFGRRNKFI